MATVKWATPASETTPLTTQLNSLADATAASASSAIDNETNLNRFLSLELTLDTQGGARSSGAYVTVHILYSSDGTNFSDSTSGPLDACQVVVFPLDAATTARIVTISGIPIQPLQFKLLLTNQTGQAFAAANNILTARTYNESVA